MIVRRIQIGLRRAYFTAMIPAAMPRLFTRLYDASFYRAMHEAWLEQLGLAPGQTAVDVGCGPGGLTRLVAEQGHHATGIDRSDRMLDAARKRDVSVGTAVFVHGDATALPFEDRSVDVVLASSLLNVVDEPVAALREMSRIVRPEGVVTALLPDPRLDKWTARAYGEAENLPVDEAALLELWAASARKIPVADAVGWFAEAGMKPARSDTHLRGMVHVTTWTA